MSERHWALLDSFPPCHLSIICKNTGSSPWRSRSIGSGTTAQGKGTRDGGDPTSPHRQAKRVGQKNGAIWMCHGAPAGRVLEPRRPRCRAAWAVKSDPGTGSTTLPLGRLRYSLAFRPVQLADLSPRLPTLRGLHVDLTRATIPPLSPSPSSPFAFGLSGRVTPYQLHPLAPGFPSS